MLNDVLYYVMYITKQALYVCDVSIIVNLATTIKILNLFPVPEGKFISQINIKVANTRQIYC